MTDLFEFARTHARRSDPDTSKSAAGKAAKLSHLHRVAILTWLRTIAPKGGTIEQIAAGTGLHKVAVARRMGELASDKAAHPGGTAMLSTGRPGRIWFAGEAA